MAANTPKTTTASEEAKGKADQQTDQTDQQTDQQAATAQSSAGQQSSVARTQIDQTIKGGRFIVGGKTVNANGKEV